MAQTYASPMAGVRLGFVAFGCLLVIACGDDGGDPDLGVDGGADMGAEVDGAVRDGGLDLGPRDFGPPPDLGLDLGYEPPSCPADSGGGSPFFVDVAAAAGIDGVYAEAATIGECYDDLAGGSVTIADYDGDDDLDVFYPRPTSTDRLFQNQGDGTYVDVAPALGLDYAGASSAAVFFDIEGDGDLDLYVTSGDRETNRLYVASPSGFTEEAASRGLDLPLSSPFLCSFQVGIAVADAEGDGDLDVLIAAWEERTGPEVDRTRLLINDGTGHFTDRTTEAGIREAGHGAFTPAFADVDGDGLLDIAITADWGRSALYRNRGDGTYEDITESAGVGTDENGMGSAIADLDGDGDLDWFVTSIFHETRCETPLWGCTGNRLYVGNGDGTFVDRTTESGVRDGHWGWGIAAVDFDHDGDLDLIHENGMTDGDLEFEQALPRLFRNDGDLTFTEVGCDHGFDRATAGRAVVPFDHDDDGDLDLLIVRSFEAPALMRNDGGNDGSWLRLRLSQPGKNPRAVGAIVTLSFPGEPERESVRRDIHLNPGFGSPGPPEAHFGLGEHEGPVDLSIRWPDGTTQSATGVSVRQRLTITRE